MSTQQQKAEDKSRSFFLAGTHTILIQAECPAIVFPQQSAAASGVIQRETDRWSAMNPS
jgi:hypothetical protein